MILLSCRKYVPSKTCPVENMSSLFIGKKCRSEKCPSNVSVDKTSLCRRWLQKQSEFMQSTIKKVDFNFLQSCKILLSVLKRNFLERSCPRYAVNSKLGNMLWRFIWIDWISEHGWLKASVNIKPEKVPCICSTCGMPQDKVNVFTAKGKVSVG